MSRRVLITGMAGLLGRFAVAEMLAHGYEVRGLGHPLQATDPMQ